MSYELIDSEKFNLLFDQMSKIKEQISTLFKKENTNNTKSVYTNKDMMSLLGIGDKLLKKYRDNGELGYHKLGDKYWYNLTDLNQFMDKTHIPAYAYN